MMNLSKSILTVVLFMIPSLLSAASKPNPTEIAKQVDRSLDQELGRGSKSRKADDVTFVNRVAFDILGRPATRAEIERFIESREKNKRTKLVEKFLDDSQFGRNWGSYWRDTILHRRTEDRAMAGAGSLMVFFQEEFNQNTPWNEIATKVITANGDIQEDGAAVMIVAQKADPEEVASETSRLFMGVQIQCARCHDHPFDTWTREQFHELAAFFPRMTMRPSLGGARRSYVVGSDDRRKFFKRKMNNNVFRPRGSLEHFMSNLDEPEDEGTKMQPVFFVTDKKLPYGTSDTDRRASIANWITSPDNPWFANAIVNRMWTELVGEGFYETVDDIGPERDCNAPSTLKLLADSFVYSGHDMKWLFRTIMATDAYQRESMSRRPDHQRPFLSNTPQRLRSDQLFEALAQALWLPVPKFDYSDGNYAKLRLDPRMKFAQVFGFDPSTPRDEVTTSIPQALAMMNSPIINRALEARRPWGLGELLRKYNDEGVVRELYIRALGREPSRAEIIDNLKYVRDAGSRREGFEDILWALVNSTEFIYRD